MRGEGAKTEIVDATAPIAEAVVREAWPYKKVLLAVLPPTLALVSVVIGVWDNGNRDRTAQAEADKDRAAALEEAERTREAEVTKDQAAAERQQRLREAELVLPRYEKLLADVHASMSVVDSCLVDLNDYLKRYNVSTTVSATAQSAGPGQTPPPPFDPTNAFAFPVDAAVVDSCSKIQEAFDPLELSLDTALLVSNPQLEAAASGLAEQLRAGSDQAQILLDNVVADPERGYTILIVGGNYLADGTPLGGVVAELNTRLAAIEPASEDVIDAVRGVVLEFEP